MPRRFYPPLGFSRTLIENVPDYRGGGERSVDAGRRQNSPEARRLPHCAGHVCEQRGCDGLVLRVAEEPQPRQFWTIDIQIRAGLQLFAAG